MEAGVQLCRMIQNKSGLPSTHCAFLWYIECSACRIGVGRRERSEAGPQSPKAAYSIGPGRRPAQRSWRREPGSEWFVLWLRLERAWCTGNVFVDTSQLRATHSYSCSCWYLEFIPKKPSRMAGSGASSLGTPCRLFALDYEGTVPTGSAHLRDFCPRLLY